MKPSRLGRAMNNCRGITLAETLIALLLMSIILLLITKYFIISMNTYHWTQEEHFLAQKSRHIAIYISNLMEKKLNPHGDALDGEIKVIYNSKNIPIIDFRENIQNPVLGTEIYFANQQNQLRTNKNGEHAILVDNVESVCMMEHGNVVECTIVFYRNHVRFIAKFPIILLKEDV